MAWRERVLCRPGQERLEDFEVESFCTPYPEVVATLRRLRFEHDFSFRGFSDMPPCEVAELTGLSHVGAEKARMRAGSEPLHFAGSVTELETFQRRLADEGLELVRHANVELMQGDSVTLRLVAQAAASQLRPTIELNRQLEPIAGQDPEIELNYRWLN